MDKTMHEILIVDDEADIREILTFNLENAGYATLQAASPAEALSRITPSTDLILLDVMLPCMSGFQLADMLRKERGLTTPIIFLTARSSENDLLTGFSAGGDDYITKPFSINEVLARIKAVIKRSSMATNSSKEIRIGDLRIDTKAKSVFLNDDSIELTFKEYEILELLARRKGSYLTRTDIIAELWKDAPYVVDRTVDVHIARLRTKLGKCRDLIESRTGYGYIIR